MTTADITAKTSKACSRFRLPDIPQREPDEVTSFDHLHRMGNAHHLARHFGNPETTLIGADRWITNDPQSFRTRARYPDLLIAFDANLAAYDANNGYVISEQGKPPDFVLEVASPSTGAVDVGAKRDDYAAMGIAEYWRFDNTGASHGERLAGDRLMDGVYVPLDIEALADGSFQGYSEVLNLHLRWENGQLGWYDPTTGRHIATFDDERARADAAEARADTAEARVRDLEAKLRHRSEG